MRLISDQEFLGEVVSLDGRTFLRCKFVDCRLVYQGFETIGLDSCHIENCIWVLAGSAQRTVEFISHISSQYGWNNNIIPTNFMVSEQAITFDEAKAYDIEYPPVVEFGFDRFLSECLMMADNGIFQSCLIAAISIPDICGAAQYPSDRNGNRYQKWCHAFTHFRNTTQFSIGGDMLWAIRNNLLHASRLDTKINGYDRIAFHLPKISNAYAHMNISIHPDGSRWLQIDLEIFTREMVNFARTWYEGAKQDPNVIGVLTKMLQLRPAGMVGMRNFAILA